MTSRKTSRRTVLTGCGSTVLLALAGCMGGRPNAVPNDVLLDLDPMAALPSRDQLNGEWTRNTPEQFVTEEGAAHASCVYTRFPSEDDVSTEDVSTSVRVSVTVCASIEVAELMLDSDHSSHTSDPDIGVSKAAYGDEGFMFHGTEDTHLQFRENNVLVDLTEMEGVADAEAQLTEFADVIVEAIEATM